MATYYLTAFSSKGECLLNEKIEAKGEQEAKKIAEEMLKKNNCDEATHRLTTSTGKLVLFHR